MPEAQWIPDRQHHIADASHFGITQFDGLQTGQLYPQDGEIGGHISADYGGACGPPVIQHHLYGIRAVYDVIISQDMPLVGHYDA
jgi:hypothetical protein